MLDEADRLGYLLGLLDLRNIPKSMKKQALIEGSRILGLRFSIEELGDIERKFSLMSMKYDGALACPLCLKRLPVEGDSINEVSTSPQKTYSKHLEGHIRVIVNRTIRRRLAKGRES